MGVVRILIVDDHPMARAGLRDMLSGFDDIEVAAEAATGYEAIQLARSRQPDLIMLDMVLPDLEGLQVLREIRRRDPLVKIVILSALDGELTVREAFANHADGYILKQVTQDELVKAVRTVMAGDIYVHPSLGAAHEHASTLGDHRLTDRQLEVLKRMARGSTNKMIAEEMGLMPETVKSHVSEIMRRLGTHHRASAVAMALRDKLI